MKNLDNHVKIKFHYSIDDEDGYVESMWAKKMEDGNYILDNIPFYVKEFALNDIISGKIINEELFVDELITESGHSTIRLVFFDESVLDRTREELKNMGCSSEISDKKNLIAVDVPPDINYEKIVLPYLEKGVNAELWDFEEGCIATNLTIM